jgi:hypothetical protein
MKAITSVTSRRQFIVQSAGALLGGGAALAEQAPASSETLAQQLYGSLSEEQKKVVCFPWEHKLRQHVDNNWHITKTPVGKLLKPDQLALVKEIFTSLHSPEMAQEVWRQFNEDSGKEGFESAAIGLFGQPGSGKFEFVFTGRHCTRRCDGDSEKGTAFGGPIFYGHASKSFNEGPSHEGNVYWFQAKRANEMFQALNGKQRELALLDTEREEKGDATVALTGRRRGLPGMPGSELSADQQGLLRGVLADLLKPFRASEREEAMKYLEASGLENLHMAFYKSADLGNDSVWDNWQIEGPHAVWYFRGAPHVHCWAHIKEPVQA